MELSRLPNRSARIRLCILSLCLLLLLAVAPLARGASFISPWRAAPVMTQPNQPVEVLLDAKPAERVVSAELQSPFSNVPVEILSQTPGEYVYDSGLKASCNLKLRVIVPAEAPADLYDLLIRTDRGQFVSPRAVQVVKQFKKRYTFVHMADAHITKDWVGQDVQSGYPRELEQIDPIVQVINIIHPDFVIHTGDDIMHYSAKADTGSRDWAQPSAAQRWDYFYGGKGRFKGFSALTMPLYVTAGNHDYYYTEDDPDGAAQYLRYNGSRVFGFTYGTSRFLVLDDSLGKDFPDAQAAVQEQWLKQVGMGDFRVICEHQPGNLDVGFADRVKANLALCGHIHSNSEEAVGSTPTLRLTTKNAGRPLSDDPGWFRIITIEDGRIVRNVALKYGDNEKCEPFLTLNYDQPNNGSATHNTARIINKLEEPFDACRIRFVMKKGKYEVTAGRIVQSFDSAEQTIVDVDVDVPARGTVEVGISGAK